MKRSSTYEHADRELAVLVKTSTDTNNRPIIEPFIEEILELCDKFGKSGQSGGSAPYTARALSQVVEKLCLHEPLCPISGGKDEWNDVSEMNGGSTLFQNSRDGRIFRTDHNSRSYFIDAIVFDGDVGGSFTSQGSVKLDGEIITSKQYIKSFPFTPKTFRIDVISTEWADRDETVKKQGGGWWTHEIKDKSQLDKVFEYYDRYVSETETKVSKEKNHVDRLKEKEPAVYGKLMDYVERHRIELLEFYPEPFDGSLQSMSQSQLSITRTAMECEKL